MAWRRISSFISRLVALFRAIRRCYHPHNCKPQFEGAPRPTRSIQPNFRRPDIEVIAFQLTANPVLQS
jgi:hypothetical protein